MNGPSAVTLSETYRKQLVSLISDLNIARRHITAYPKGHPVIATAAAKAFVNIQDIHKSHDSITLGITKDTILIDGERLDEQNPVIGNFARELFSRGVVILIIHQGVTIDEVIRFNEILAMKSERIGELGGMEKLLEAAGVTNLSITEIDYRLFHLADSDEPAETSEVVDTPTLWSLFIDGLLAGTLDPEGKQAAADQTIEPEKLAAMINEQLLAILPSDISRFDQQIKRFLRTNDRPDASDRGRADSAEILGRFILALSPEARRTMLQSSLHTLADCRYGTEDMLSRFPDELILDALAESGTNADYAPPTILKLLTKLARTGSSQQRIAGEHPEQEDAEFVDKLKVLFQEQEFSRFVPTAYQQALDTFITSNSLGSDDSELMADLQATLSGNGIEAEVGNIILELLKRPADAWAAGVLSRNLIELCDFFLSTGDFQSLIRVHAEVSARFSTPNAGDETTVLDVFSRPEFTEEVLNAPVVWGKTKFDEISQLIRKVGPPFIEPLLTHMAEESSISLRRFFMDRLLELGSAARDAAILRLADKRWYVVRNVLVILRNLDDPSSVRFLYRLGNHPHPKVRQELTRTLIHFKDPEGDRLVLKEMVSTDFETRSNAIQAAGKCSNPVVVQALLEIVQKGGLSGQEFELKRLAVNALADIGTVAVLPELERVLRNKNFLHPVMHSRLKGEIIKSLERYPAAAARKLLEPFAGGSGELSRLAQDALKNLGGRTP